MKRCHSLLAAALIAVPLIVLPATANAQGLRNKVLDLFRFGDCGEPLCLPSLVQQGNVHGNHYVPSAVASGGVVLDFLTSAIGTSLSNLPIAATTSGATFSFVGGAPVKTTLSAGPIFAERAQTLGRGRMLFGANVSVIRFNSLRGVPLNNVEFNIIHENGQVPNEVGNPLFENDILTVTSDIQLTSYISSLFFTYGVSDRLDFGVALPLVRTELQGRSYGEIIAFGPNTPHYFGGTAQNPQLSAVAATSGSATGIGDVAARMKLNLAPSGASGGAALLAEVRLPTGKEEDLLGAGEMSTRVFAVFSNRYGNFSPHANVGGVMRQGTSQNNSVLVTAGFDQLVTSQATFALDVISEWQMGNSRVSLPEPVTFTQPYRRVVSPTNIPNIKDNLFNLAAGGKYSASNGVNLVLNVLVPLNRGGLRPSSIVTAGLEKTF